jgi:hypothetical protein
MAAKNLPKDLLAQVEHFQNSFICQKEVIDKLRHDLPDSRHKVENIYNSRHEMSSQDGLRAHDLLSDRMDMFRRIYQEVRDHFTRFEAEWM